MANIAIEWFPTLIYYGKALEDNIERCESKILLVFTIYLVGNFFVIVNRLDWSRVLPQAVGLGLGATQAAVECRYFAGIWICIG